MLLLHEAFQVGAGRECLKFEQPQHCPDPIIVEAGAGLGQGVDGCEVGLERHGARENLNELLVARALLEEV